MEIKITVEKVPMGDWEDIRFDFYKNGKNRASWWTGGGHSYIDVAVNVMVEAVRTELERYVESIE